MNYSQIGILFFQASLITFVILLLFRLRRKLGIGVLFACLGLFQFMQVFLSSTVYVSVTNNLIVSPGSTVLFTATLFALLIIYIKEGASETKKIIYALFIVNILISVYLPIFGWSLKETTHNPFNVSTQLFDTSAWVLFVGTILLFIDSLIIIKIFEFISKKTRFLFLQICITMLLVVCFDAISFSLLVFWASDNLLSVLISGLISKAVFALFYSIPFYFYLRYFDRKLQVKNFFKIKDFFQPLTYKQKYESAADSIKKVEEMYGLLANNSNDIVCLQEVDSTFKYISPSLKRILGYENSYFIGKTFLDIVHPDDIEDFKQKIDQIFFKNNTDNLTFTYRFCHNNGHYVWLEFLTSIVYKAGKINYFVTSGRDVTQRVFDHQNIEDTIKLLEEKEHSLSEASKMAKIGYWEYNIETKNYTWSDYIHVIYGSDPREPLPLTEEIINSFDKESRKKLIRANVKLKSKGKPYDLELSLVNLKNKTVWIRNVVQPIYCKNTTKIIGRRGVLQDITDKKITELKLKENEEKFFNIFKSSPNLITLTRLKDYKITDANETALKATGYTSAELTGGDIDASDIWQTPNQRPKYFNKLKENKQISNFVTEFITKSGAIRTWKASSQIIKITDEEYALSIIEDITEIKKAQEELKKQSEFVTAITENQSAGIVACNAKGELVLFNKTAKQWHGIDILKVPKEEWAKNYGLYKVDGETLIEAEEIPLIQAFRGKKIINSELVIKAKNQEPRIVVCNATCFSDTNNNILGALVVMTDVTKQKLIENNLKRSKDEIKHALKEVERSEFLLNESGRLAKIGAWELKLPSEEIRWSNQVFEIHGLPVGKIPPYEECVDFYIDGSAEILSKAIEESIAENKKFDLVLRFNNKKNEKLWVKSIGYPLTNKDGEITSLIGVFQDITEQKNKQIKLDEQNEKLIELNKVLNEAQELAQLGNWEFIIDSNKVTWSKEVFKIFEIPEELGAPNFSQHISLYTEKSFIKLKEAIFKCVHHQKPFKLELDVCAPNGSIKHIISRGLVLRDKNKKIIGCYGTVQDVTEQKQIRDNIAKAEEMYRLLTDNSNDLICLHNLDSTFKYISPSIKSLLGYKQSDLIETPGFNIIHEEDLDYFKTSLENRINKKTPNDTFFSRAIHKKGHVVWLECSVSIIYLDDKIDAVLTSSRDVTEKVLAKQKIEKYQESLQELTTEITLVEEKQKKEIATNIHDHLSQSLVISNMKIKELRKVPDLKIIDNDLEFVYDHINDALVNSRKITSELSPPVLYQLGIIEALYWLLENIESKHKIKYKVDDTIEEIELDDVQSILLYRCIQELFNNIIKYAQATLISVDFNKTNLGVNIIIKDNGKGFNTENLNGFYSKDEKGSGFGLFSVKERIKNIKGEFKIESKIGEGTTVTIFIPIKE
ncbi:PAS domain S-box protein [Polaribacter vadi]|uniref:PAS domain S-box protein n=1 Tax=Polaribacter TaxID=52959 RepID=UPI001C093CDC|nr:MULTISPECIES: PAS domain S-box protein [Polaribacter]MBU3011524.1 PAS domain S-box protein [Polaribacter vadi]MDO6741336.1 PAS domain S-box protein [Polaribacter sp. 1_MG-2023]